MSKMKDFLLAQAEEVQHIVAARPKVSLAFSGIYRAIAQVPHSSTLKALMRDLANAGYHARAMPFINGQYNVLVRFNTL